MKDVKNNIVKNLVALRKQKKLTQQELGAEINYSDKAISRWENGESLPDIGVLENLCDFYGVEFEYLISEHDTPPTIAEKTQTSMKIAIVSLAAVICFALATIIFVYLQLIKNVNYWKIFIYAIPASLIIAYFYCRKWWKGIASTIIFSLFCWSLIAAIFVYLLPLNTWALFLLGVPAQCIIALTYYIKKTKN